MKKVALLAISLMIFVCCNEATLPDLPEMEDSVDVDSFNIGKDGDVSGEDGGGDSDLADDGTFADSDSDQAAPALNSGILLATTKGYDAPYSGKVFYSKDEKFDSFKEILTNRGMGSASGADITLGSWEEGFAVVGRYDSSTLYFFEQNLEGGFDETRSLEIAPETVPNLQDIVYNPVRDEFIVSALNGNRLFIIKNFAVSELEISENKNASPSKMRVIDDKLYVTLLNLNEEWRSEKGEIAVLDLENYSIQRVELPKKNPTGKIEYNPNVDGDNLYFVATGDSQKRDGAILQMGINSHEIKSVLEESPEENNLLDGDFVDLSISDGGDFYIIFANNSSGWVNNLLKFSPSEGVVSKIESNINAFAANPIDFSSASGKIYYFVDVEADVYLKSLNTKSGETERLKLTGGPAAVKVLLSN